MLRICQDIPISFGGVSWDEVGQEEMWPVCSQGNTALAASSGQDSLPIYEGVERPEMKGGSK